jgi:hypothetical protein
MILSAADFEVPNRAAIWRIVIIISSAALITPDTAT